MWHSCYIHTIVEPVLAIDKSTWKMYILLAIACMLGAAAAAPSGDYGHVAAIDSYSIPSYGFNYAVNDPVTGDNKAQSEVREGGVVKGSYSLAEPDGTLRVVEYTADDVRGFNAIVKRIGAAVHPQQLFTPVVKHIVQPIAAPVYEPIAAPIYRPIAAPVYRSIIAPINSGYSIPNLYNLGGYERELGLGWESGFGNWNQGRLGLRHGGWNH